LAETKSDPVHQHGGPDRFCLHYRNRLFSLLLWFRVVSAVLLLGLADDAGVSAADAGMFTGTLELSQTPFFILLAAGDARGRDLVMFA